MSDKAFPKYKLEIQTSSGSIVIPDGDRLFNIEASVKYACNESPNTCDITIYNLNKTSRDAIFHDSYDYFEFRKMTFMAGYGDDLQMLFNGSIKEAYSDRQGPDVSTIISGWDGFWYNNNLTTRSIDSGADRNTAIKNILRGVKNGEGYIKTIMSDFNNLPKNLRAETFSGRPQDLVKERIGQDATLFYDDGKLFVLKDNDAIGKEGSIPLINSESGLIGVPVKRNKIVEFRMVFEPSLRIGRAFELQSSFSDKLNGVYKAIEITHDLSLGENIGGSNTTTVKAWSNNQGFNYIGLI